MLEIRSLTVAYGSHQAITDVSVRVGGGEILAVIGPNGAGKTTLIRAASGVLPLNSGVVMVAGREMAQLTPSKRARLLAVVPQARRLPAAFTVWQAVAIGRTPYLGWLGKTHPEDETRIRWALEKTELLELAVRRLGDLSGGEQQRVLLARALAQGAPILMLDEPTAHLDLPHQSNLLNLVRDLARTQALAVLMAMHDLNAVALYADRVALLVAGQLKAQGSPEEVLTPDLLSAAYRMPVRVIPHPDYGTPLILPDGKLSGLEQPTRAAPERLDTGPV